MSLTFLPSSPQESIDYCQNCLETIYLTSGSFLPEVVVVENHFESTFKPHVEEPTKVCIHEVHFSSFIVAYDSV